jgi:hypothetical protein
MGNLQENCPFGSDYAAAPAGTAVATRPNRLPVLPDSIPLAALRRNARSPSGDPALLLARNPALCGTAGVANIE